MNGGLLRHVVADFSARFPARQNDQPTSGVQEGSHDAREGDQTNDEAHCYCWLLDV